MTVTTANADLLGPLLQRLTGDEKHAPSAHSTLDVLWVLYDRILRITPETVDEPDRDRFLLSKGHGPAAYYAVLAAKGFIPAEWLDDFGGRDSPLGHHPDRTLIPGVEIGTGSLGHGLGLAVGTALGLRAQGYLTPQVFVLLGDAELDEGSNHEAIAYAARDPAAADRDRDRQPVRDARLARRHRRAVPRLDHLHRGRPRPRRHLAAPGRTATSTARTSSSRTVERRK